MLDNKVKELLNAQIAKEFYSAYLYLDFSNFYYDLELNGFGNWYRIQAQEERDHAMLFLDYLKENGVRADLELIEKPVIKEETAKGILAQGLEHEQYVTSLINDIYAAAYEVKDFRTMEFQNNIYIHRYHISNFFNIFTNIIRNQTRYYYRIG